MNLEPRRVPPLDFAFQRRAEAGNVMRSFIGAGAAGAGIPELRAEPAQVVALAAGAMIEARHVDVLAADAAIVPRRRAGEHGKESGRIQPDLLAEVAADHVGAVAKTVRVPLGCRVKEQPCRIDAAGAD